MKKYLNILLIIGLTCTYAQVGIGTNNPSATLEIKVDPSSITTPTNSPPGFIAPKISGNDLKSLDNNYLASQTGAIVFVTSIPTNNSESKTVDINSVGFYYFNGTKWEKIGSEYGEDNSVINSNWFYSPSIVLPTIADNVGTINGYSYDAAEETFKVDLHLLYNNQFISPIKSSTDAPNLDIKAKNELDYYITYYDTKVFNDVKINLDGLLTYKIFPNGIVSEDTFMNIIFKPRQ